VSRLFRKRKESSFKKELQNLCDAFYTQGVKDGSNQMAEMPELLRDYLVGDEE